MKTHAHISVFVPLDFSGRILPEARNRGLITLMLKVSNLVAE